MHAILLLVLAISATSTCRNNFVVEAANAVNKNEANNPSDSKIGDGKRRQQKGRLSVNRSTIL